MDVTLCVQNANILKNQTINLVGSFRLKMKDIVYIHK